MQRIHSLKANERSNLYELYQKHIFFSYTIPVSTLQQNSLAAADEPTLPYCPIDYLPSDHKDCLKQQKNICKKSFKKCH